MLFVGKFSYVCIFKVQKRFALPFSFSNASFIRYQMCAIQFDTILTCIGIPPTIIEKILKRAETWEGISKYIKLFYFVVIFLLIHWIILDLVCCNQFHKNWIYQIGQIYQTLPGCSNIKANAKYNIFFLHQCLLIKRSLLLRYCLHIPWQPLTILSSAKLCLNILLLEAYNHSARIWWLKTILVCTTPVCPV